MNTPADLTTPAGRALALDASKARLAAACQPIREQAGAAPPDRRPLVLIVEDDARQGRLYMALLRHVARVAVAADPEQATAIYVQNRPDLILADGPGIGWAEGLDDDAPPRVIVSGSDHTNRPGFARILMKPVETDTLEALIEELALRRTS